MQSCRKSGELYQSCPILQSDTCQYSGSSDKEAHLFYLECESQHRLLGKIKNAAISALIRLRFVNSPIFAPRHYWYYSFGKRSVTVVPFPSLLSRRRSPPSICIRRLASVSPMPEPLVVGGVFVLCRKLI